MNPARRRQIAREIANRNRIAREAADRSAATPHFGGHCPECDEGEAHWVNSLGRVVHMPMKHQRPWWERLLRRIGVCL